MICYYNFWLESPPAIFIFLEIPDLVLWTKCYSVFIRAWPYYSLWHGAT